MSCVAVARASCVVARAGRSQLRLRQTQLLSRSDAAGAGSRVHITAHRAARRGLCTPATGPSALTAEEAAARSARENRAALFKGMMAGVTGMGLAVVTLHYTFGLDHLIDTSGHVEDDLHVHPILRACTTDQITAVLALPAIREALDVREPKTGKRRRAYVVIEARPTAGTSRGEGKGKGDGAPGVRLGARVEHDPPSPDTQFGRNLAALLADKYDPEAQVPVVLLDDGSAFGQGPFSGCTTAALPTDAGYSSS